MPKYEKLIELTRQRLANTESFHCLDDLSNEYESRHIREIVHHSGILTHSYPPRYKGEDNRLDLEKQFLKKIGVKGITIAMVLFGETKKGVVKAFPMVLDPRENLSLWHEYIKHDYEDVLGLKGNWQGNRVYPEYYAGEVLAIDKTTRPILSIHSESSRNNAHHSDALRKISQSLPETVIHLSHNKYGAYTTFDNGQAVDTVLDETII